MCVDILHSFEADQLTEENHQSQVQPFSGDQGGQHLQSVFSWTLAVPLLWPLAFCHQAVHLHDLQEGRQAVRRKSKQDEEEEPKSKKSKKDDKPT